MVASAATSARGAREIAHALGAEDQPRVAACVRACRCRRAAAGDRAAARRAAARVPPDARWPASASAAPRWRRPRPASPPRRAGRARSPACAARRPASASGPQAARFPAAARGCARRRARLRCRALARLCASGDDATATTHRDSTSHGVRRTSSLTVDLCPVPPSECENYTAVGRIIGLDVGERRIGVAISDATGTLARPVTTLRTTGLDGNALELALAEIGRLAAEDDGVAAVVVGLPRRLDGITERDDPARRSLRRAPPRPQRAAGEPAGRAADERGGGEPARGAREGLARSEGAPRRRRRGDHSAGLSGRATTTHEKDDHLYRGADGRGVIGRGGGRHRPVGTAARAVQRLRGRRTVRRDSVGAGACGDPAAPGRRRGGARCVHAAGGAAVDRQLARRCRRGSIGSIGR